MVKIYLACLIFGGIFIAVTLLFGGDGDVDLDVDADMDVDLDVDADVGGDVDIDAGGEGMTAAIKFLSFRNIVFFLAFFGLTGTVLTWLNAPFLLVLAAAIGMGFGAATLMHRVMSHLLKNEVGQALSVDSLVGLPAKVIINITKDHRGKVMLDAGGQELQLLALSADEAAKDEFSAGEIVYILRVENGTVYVVEEAFIDSPME